MSWVEVEGNEDDSGGFVILGGKEVLKEFGVSIHFVDKRFFRGPIWVTATRHDGSWFTISIGVGGGDPYEGIFENAGMFKATTGGELKQMRGYKDPVIQILHDYTDEVVFVGIEPIIKYA